MGNFRDKAELLTDIKMDMGIYCIQLPLSDLDLYKYVIVKKTLPTYSVYNPWRYPITIDLEHIRINDRQCAEDGRVESNMYRIPPVVDSMRNDIRILGIESLYPCQYVNGMYLTPSYSTIEAYQALAIGQGLADLSSTMIPPLTFEFLPPNRFRIYNTIIYNNRVDMVLQLTHTPELYSIPETSRESFYELALLDVKMFVYNNLKYFNGMETAIGRLDLKIDQWESAEQDRKELLNEWSNTYHMDLPIYYV